MEKLNVFLPSKIFTRVDLMVIILPFYGTIKSCKFLMTQLRKKSYKIWNENTENWTNYLKHTKEKLKVIPSMGVLGSLLAYNNCYLYDLSISLLSENDYQVFENFLSFVSNPKCLTISRISLTNVSSFKFQDLLSKICKILQKIEPRAIRNIEEPESLIIRDDRNSFYDDPIPELQQLEDVILGESTFKVLKLIPLFRLKDPITFLEDGIIIDSQIKHFPPEMKDVTNENRKEKLIQAYMNKTCKSCCVKLDDFIGNYANNDFNFTETEKANLKEFTIICSNENYDAEIKGYIKDFVKDEMKFIIYCIPLILLIQ